MPQNNQPRFRAIHGLVYASKVSDVDNFYGGLYENLMNDSSGAKDRAQTATFQVPQLGKVVLSKTNGAVTVYTDDKQQLSKLESKIGKVNWEELQRNLICRSIGIHAPRITLEVNQTISTIIPTEIGETRITVTYTRDRKYDDTHIHIRTPPLGDTPNGNGEEEAEIPKKRKRISDIELIEYAKRNTYISSKNAEEFGLTSKGLSKRLLKLCQDGRLERIEVHPAIYALPRDISPNRGQGGELDSFAHSSL